MPYRNELDAAHARIATLEAELARRPSRTPGPYERASVEENRWAHPLLIGGAIFLCVMFGVAAATTALWSWWASIIYFVAMGTMALRIFPFIRKDLEEGDPEPRVEVPHCEHCEHCRADVARSTSSSSPTSGGGVGG